jgi:hypothetical protein
MPETVYPLGISIETAKNPQSPKPFSCPLVVPWRLAAKNGIEIADLFALASVEAADHVKFCQAY